jgi:membrane protease YdiL (CAAX protease family)
MRHLVERYPIWAYLVAAYAFSWSFWSVLLLTTPPDVMQKGPPPAFFLFAALGGIGPSLAGIATTATVDGNLRDLFSGFRWSRPGNKWYAAALLISPFLGLMTLAVERTLGLPTATVAEMIETVPLCLIFPFFSACGEEIGWRGFLLPKLQKRHSAFKSSILVGVAWGLWHIPTQILAMRQFGAVVVLASIFVSHIVAMTAHSVVATWLYNNSSQSLLLVMMYHYSLTFTAIFMGPLSSSDSAMLPHWLIFALLYWVAALIITVTSGSEHLVQKPFKTYQA